MDGEGSKEQLLEDEIRRLREELSQAQSRSNPLSQATELLSPLPSHALLLLSDSALPLGSFAFSSGLESYLAHHHHTQQSSHAVRPQTLPTFVSLSIQSLAAATLPYMIAVHRSPQQLQDLDDVLDASILCPVAKRASVAQGRALLTLWQRALRHGYNAASEAGQALRDFDIKVKKSAAASTTFKPASNRSSTGANGTIMEGAETVLTQSQEQDSLPLHAHFPLMWGAVCAGMDLNTHETAYTFLFNHAKAIMSAGVRASVMGPYAAQQLLGGEWLRREIEMSLENNWNVSVEDAGQSVPMIDLWIGRHELLYSRIFNS